MSSSRQALHSVTKFLKRHTKKWYREKMTIQRWKQRLEFCSSKPRNICCHSKLKEARISSQPSEEVSSSQNLDFGFLAFRTLRDKFLLFQVNIIFFVCVVICYKSHRILLHLLQHLINSFLHISLFQFCSSVINT